MNRLFPIVLLCVVAGLAGCEPAAPQIVQLEAPAAAPVPAPALAAAPAPSDPPLELRTYQLPEAIGDRVYGLLNNLNRGDEPVGRFQLAPGGRLVAVAPATLHTGIEALVKELEGADLGAEAPSTIEVDYWLVLGRRSGPTTELPEIQNALDAVVKNQGEMSFTLLERASLQSADGDFARSSGIIAEFEQTVSSAGEDIHARVNVRTIRGQSIETRVQVKEGQVVVLGQVGADPRLESLTDEELRVAQEEVRLFYVLRARKL